VSFVYNRSRVFPLVKLSIAVSRSPVVLTFAVNGCWLQKLLSVVKVVCYVTQRPTNAIAVIGFVVTSSLPHKRERTKPIFVVSGLKELSVVHSNNYRPGGL
jgi:hypothetical protein